MRLVAPQIPQPLGDMREWAKQVTKILQEHANRATQQINQASEGAISGVTNAASSVPTTGTWAVGDFVRNSAPSETATTTLTYDQLGHVATGAYVLFGWVCVTAGTPGTWKECRYLTGN